MEKPLFDIVVVARNESKTLPKLLQSLTEFKSRGGKVFMVDTGSIDETVKIAKDWGVNVFEVGDKFNFIIDKDLAEKINKRFVVGGESDIVKEGDKLFDFALARNFISSMASQDITCTLDCDEAYTVFDIDKINHFIKEGYEQFEYSFIFAHDPWGRPALEFIQSKFYDRRKLHWTGVVHEVLEGQAKIKYLDKSIILLEHWQLPNSDHRGKYLTGLAWDCFHNQNKDRQSHYLARELLWTNRPKSAIKEFERHIRMNKWLQERAQSIIFMGDAYGKLNQPEKQVEMYNKAFYYDSSRRESLVKLAEFYRHNNNPKATASYASAALEIPFSPYYANDKSHYEQRPHELLYWAKGWTDDIKGAQEHLLKALEYQPYNEKILEDTKYYFEYAAPKIEGWMEFPELQFLYEMSKKMDTVCEVGSWKGRSTHALLSGGAQITAVDTFEGSDDVKDATNWLAKQENIFDIFKKNTRPFTNLTINKGRSVKVAKQYKDKSFDAVFVDAGHTYKDIKEDIAAWRNKAKILFCGHDYKPGTWMDIIKAVDEELGAIDGVAGTVWYKWVVKPKVSIIIPHLGRPEKLNRLIWAIKENAGYDNYEVIVENDQFPPNNLGVPKILKKAVEKSTGELIAYLGNDCVPQKDFLQLAVFRMIKNFPDLDGMVAFNDGYWINGEVATHFLISKKLLPKLDGEIFHTGYFHTGCDNELQGRCEKMDKYVWEEKALVKHDHPIHTGFKPEEMDEVYKLAYREDRLKHDKESLRERARKIGFELKENFIKPTRIPKTIFTIWLSEDKKMPDLVQECIKTHQIKGYKHKMITLDNCFMGHDYLQEALKVKAWGKMCDFLRIYYLIQEGGIYLDADVRVLKGKNFDSLLENSVFVARENNGFINTAVIGAEKGNKALKEHLQEMITKFRGDDGLFFEASIEIFTPRIEKTDAKILSAEYFYPYDHQRNTENITSNSITYHYFLKSWKK